MECANSECRKANHFSITSLRRVLRNPDLSEVSNSDKCLVDLSWISKKTGVELIRGLDCHDLAPKNYFFLDCRFFGYEGTCSFNGNEVRGDNAPHLMGVKRQNNNLFVLKTNATLTTDDATSIPGVSSFRKMHQHFVPLDDFLEAYLLLSESDFTRNCAVAIKEQWDEVLYQA